MYIKKEEDKLKPVMEYFIGILFHKSGHANKQHTNQSSLIISTFLIVSATFQSSSYQIFLTKLDYIIIRTNTIIKK